MKAALLLFLTIVSLTAQPTNDAALQRQIETFVQGTEKIRSDCIDGRRKICGRIVRILPGGFVIDSGYTNLLRPPLDRSWLVPGTVEAARPADMVEAHEPGSVCVGLIYLTNLPKSRGAKPKPYDYVVIDAYPDGEYTYTSVGTVRHTVRRFSATLENAVELNRAAAGIQRPIIK